MKVKCPCCGNEFEISPGSALAQIRTPKRAEAARLNGILGGRPKVDNPVRLRPWHEGHPQHLSWLAEQGARKYFLERGMIVLDPPPKDPADFVLEVADARGRLVQVPADIKNLHDGPRYYLKVAEDVVQVIRPGVGTWRISKEEAIRRLCFGLYNKNEALNPKRNRPHKEPARVPEIDFSRLLGEPTIPPQP